MKSKKKNRNEREPGEKSLERNGTNKWKVRRENKVEEDSSARGRDREKIFKKKRKALNFENEGARTAEEKD